VSTFGKSLEKAAYKTQEYLDERTGADISLGNLSGMNVEMVKVLEPLKKYAIISNYLNNRLIHVTEILTKMFSFSKRKESLKDLKELMGLTIILNETESAAAEVLLSTRKCLLGSDDYYFKRSIDPCRELSKEALIKIISRVR
jgi:hypothetical protein